MEVRKRNSAPSQEAPIFRVCRFPRRCRTIMEVRLQGTDNSVQSVSFAGGNRFAATMQGRLTAIGGSVHVIMVNWPCAARVLIFPVIVGVP